MDALKLLLWLALMAVAVMQVSCGDDREKRQMEGPASGGTGGSGNGKAKGCVVAPPHDCSSGNYSFTCHQPLSPPKNGGAACPPQIEITDPSKPAQDFHLCTVGPWGPCLPLVGFPGVWVRRRSPIDPTSVISTCPPLIMLCNFNIPVNCIVSDWSIWNYFWAQGIRVRVRFIIIQPLNGGAPCPHLIEIQPIGGGGGCNYGPWGAWTQFGGTCFRTRTSSGAPGCTFTTQTKSPPCSFFSSCNYGPWGAWTQIGSICHRTRTSSGAPGCTFTVQTKSLPCGFSCFYTAWSQWTQFGGSSTCVRTRSSVPPFNPSCPLTREFKSAPCFTIACARQTPVTGEGGALEGPAGTRKKRDLPYCPETTMIIYGRADDNCRANMNATWYRCINMLCQNCVPPAGRRLICIPDKFTQLIIPLTCATKVNQQLIVWRPMACTCYDDTTCTKFGGPCGFFGG